MATRNISPKNPETFRSEAKNPHPPVPHETKACGLADYQPTD